MVLYYSGLVSKNFCFVGGDIITKPVMHDFSIELFVDYSQTYFIPGSNKLDASLSQLVIL